MKKKKLIEVTFICLVFAFLIFVGAFILKQVRIQFSNFCAEKNWTGVYNFSGDVSGQINCSAMRNYTIKKIRS